MCSEFDFKVEHIFFGCLMKWKILFFYRCFRIDCNLKGVKAASFRHGCFNLKQLVTDFSPLTSIAILIPKKRNDFFRVESDKPFEELNWLLNRFTVYENSSRWNEKKLLVLDCCDAEKNFWTFWGPFLLCPFFNPLDFGLLIELWWSAVFDE